MKKKIQLMLIGGFWGIIIFSLIDSIGDKSEASVMTAWNVLNVGAILLFVSIVAIETYKSLKED